MNDALSMGNYGAFVWSSYALTAAVVAICIWQGKRRHTAIVNDIKLRISAMETDV